MQETAKLFGVSEQTLYRALRERTRPKLVRRTDRGAPRILPQERMERYCELIAAMEVRTSDKKGRHLSTSEGHPLAGRLRARNPGRVGSTASSGPEKGDGQPLFAALGLRRGNVGPPAGGGPLPGRAQQREQMIPCRTMESVTGRVCAS